MKFAERRARALGAYRRIASAALVTSAFACLAPTRVLAAAAEPAVSGMVNPGAIAYCPELHRVYAVDRAGGRLAIHDVRQGTTTMVPVGGGPVSVALDGTRARAYVADADDGILAVVDAVSGARLGSLAVGGRPYSVAADPARARAYVTDASGDGITEVDLATLATSRIRTGSADLVAVDPVRGTAYLIGYGTALRVLDGNPGAVREVPAGRHAWGLSLDGARGTAFVCLLEDSRVAELDGRSGACRLLPAGEIPCACALDPVLRILVVANYGGDSVTVLDVASGRVLATLPVASHPVAVAVDPERHLAFLAGRGERGITVVDIAARRVLLSLPGGANPYAMAVVPGSDRLYVADNDMRQPFTVVDLRALRVSPR